MTAARNSYRLFHMKRDRAAKTKHLITPPHLCIAFLQADANRRNHASIKTTARPLPLTRALPKARADSLSAHGRTPPDSADFFPATDNHESGAADSPAVTDKYESCGQNPFPATDKRESCGQNSFPATDKRNPARKIPSQRSTSTNSAHKIPSQRSTSKNLARKTHSPRGRGSVISTGPVTGTSATNRRVCAGKYSKGGF